MYIVVKVSNDFQIQFRLRLNNLLSIAGHNIEIVSSRDLTSHMGLLYWCTSKQCFNCFRPVL